MTEKRIMLSISALLWGVYLNEFMLMIRSETSRSCTIHVKNSSALLLKYANSLIVNNVLQGKIHNRYKYAGVRGFVI